MKKIKYLGEVNMKAYDLFAKEVKKQIAIHDLTQQEIAEIADVNRITINQLVNGFRSKQGISFCTALRIAYALGISMDKIMKEGNDEQRRKSVVSDYDSDK